MALVASIHLSADLSSVQGKVEGFQGSPPPTELERSGQGTNYSLNYKKSKMQEDFLFCEFKGEKVKAVFS